MKGSKLHLYVASSWRNEIYPSVVEALREDGHVVYDFRAPDPGGTTPGGFSWSEIDPEWKSWTPKQFIEALSHSKAQHGFARDYAAMLHSHVCVMVQPCGVSAALELGWCSGIGKRTIALVREGPRFEPELMLNLADLVTDSLDKVRSYLLNNKGAILR